MIGLDELITSLLAHQMLLQLIHQLLSDGSSSDLLTTGVLPKPPNPHEESSQNENRPRIGSAAVAHLLFSLDATIVVCEQFDVRPALKKLLQQIAGLILTFSNRFLKTILGLRSISNLYKLFVVAHSLRLQCLFKIVIRGADHELEHGKRCLSILESTFSTLFCELQQFEQVALKNKVNLFMRQRVEDVREINQNSG